MVVKRFSQEGRQFIIQTDRVICTTPVELIRSDMFRHVMALYVRELKQHESPLVEALGIAGDPGAAVEFMTELLSGLCARPLEELASSQPSWAHFTTPGAKNALHEFVEGLYDYWRRFYRFMVLRSEPGTEGHDRRPYRAFNEIMEGFTHLVRSTYRDLCENIVGDHPRIYRQVAAGCNVGLIAVPKEPGLDSAYAGIVDGVPFIRQVLIAPPLIIDPPMNTRTGEFKRVDVNPLEGLSINREEWLCYPAQVGPLIIYVYFHQRFMGLGCALSNLFELATDAHIGNGPDAMFMFGVPPEAMSCFGELPTVFYDDEETGMITAAIPCEDRFGYFGYLKKMTLTLHNIIMMKRGRMPYHGAMVKIMLKGGMEANLLIIGDTGTGKSESLEAFRTLGDARIREMRVVADDMGSLEITQEGRLVAYGTETGAFIRLDDLQKGYAFGQIDRAIIMSPQKVNARVVLPLTTIEEVLRGYPIDYLLYANNYEEVDGAHPILERMDDMERALAVFREGAALAKGTTTSKGLGHCYFANIFGPPQYRELHEPIALKTFDAAFGSGVWIGQLRTRLGVPGCETRGPEEAARALLDMMDGR